MSHRKAGSKKLCGARRVTEHFARAAAPPLLSAATACMERSADSSSLKASLKTYSN